MANGFKLRSAVDEIPVPTMNGGIDMQESRQEVTFDNQALPEVDSWKVGAKYLLVVEVTMMSSRIPRSEEEPGEDSEKEARFQINQVGAYNPEVDQVGALVKQKLKLG